MSPKPFIAAAAALATALLACSTQRPPGTNYLDDFPAFAQPELVNVVIEIPAGTNQKWEVVKTGGALRWEERGGKPRVIQYLAYPANYGMIPRTLLPHAVGGDGDPLDVILLGPARERGAVVPARPIGVLRLVDDGERDDKVVAVATAGPLSDLTDLAGLDAQYPGARAILETWFTHYKGAGRLASNGFSDAAAALEVVQEASRYYEAGAHPSNPIGSETP